MSSPEDTTATLKKQNGGEKSTKVDVNNSNVLAVMTVIFIVAVIGVILFIFIGSLNGYFKDGESETSTDDSGGVDSFRKGYDNYNSGKFGIDFMQGGSFLGPAPFANILSPSNSESNDSTYHGQSPGAKGGSSINVAGAKSGAKDGSSGGFF